MINNTQTINVLHMENTLESTSVSRL